MLGLFDDRRRLRDLPSEDVPLDEVGEPHRQLVTDVLTGWD